jgi:antitoxin ChpS
MLPKPDETNEATRKKPRYTIQELLAQCDPDAPHDEETIEWVNAPSVGREIPT